jgi:hypothetical protein
MVPTLTLLLVDSLVCLCFGLVCGAILGARFQMEKIRWHVKRDFRAADRYVASLFPEERAAWESLSDE